MIMGCAVKADETITFAAGKLGLYMNDGIACSGQITIADICIPFDQFCSICSQKIRKLFRMRCQDIWRVTFFSFRPFPQQIQREQILQN